MILNNASIEVLIVYIPESATKPASHQLLSLGRVVFHLDRFLRAGIFCGVRSVATSESLRDHHHHHHHRNFDYMTCRIASSRNCAKHCKAKKVRVHPVNKLARLHKIALGCSSLHQAFARRAQKYLLGLR